MKTSIERRQFLKMTTLYSAAVMVGQSGCSLNRSKNKKPNLLFIWTDEQRPDTMRVYGNEKIMTPELDRFADESIVFRRAYVSQPVCTPSRSTIMTGHWPHTTGLLGNNIPLPEDVPCLNELIGDPEYRSAYMGKWHLGEEVFRQHNFDEWVSIEDYYWEHLRDRSARSSYHHYLISLGYEPDNENGTFSRTFSTNRPLEQCKPRFLETKACDFLRQNQNQPFILYVNFLEPHMPFNGPLNDKYPPQEMDFPKNYNDIMDKDDPVSYRLKQVNEWKYSEPEFLKKEKAKYWGLVSQVDMSVGTILRTLEELKLDNNTIVVFTSDHGDMMGSHRMIGKGVMYEESVRVPWIMRIPWMGRKQRIVESPVSQIDIVPTLLELMRVPQNDRLPGKSLLPLINGREVEQDYVFIEWNERPRTYSSIRSSIRPEYKNLNISPEEIANARSANIRTVISPDGWKLNLSDKDRSQLFNINDDPGEIDNLFYSGKHQDVIERLTKKIHEWQKKTKDTIQI